jgi:hypothetical protein
MNPPNKKPPAARGIPLPFTQRNGPAHQFKPPVAQLKNAVSPLRPVAPPVYRPQPVPRVLQTKKDHLRVVKAEFKASPSISKIARPVVQPKHASPMVTARTFPARAAGPVAHIHAHLPGGRFTGGYRTAVVQRAEEAAPKRSLRKRKESVVDENGEVVTPEKKEKLMMEFMGVAGVKHEWAEAKIQGLGQGQCGAVISYKDGAATRTCKGEYDDDSGYHAEMDALDKFLAAGKNISSIKTIKITSPPCKACNAVLNLLGLTDKVKVPRGMAAGVGHRSSYKVPPRVMSLVFDKWRALGEDVVSDYIHKHV